METSIASPLVSLTQRHTVPEEAAARAARELLGGVNDETRAKLGPKSYMLCALITEVQGIDTGTAGSP